MIKIDMDNGKRYTFDKYEHYFLNNEYLVITDSKDDWIGCYSVKHLIGYFVEP